MASGSSTTLVHLDLSSNDLNGSILDGFGNMISLAYLDLRYCAFEGEILFAFGDMRALEYLDISGHGLHGEIPNKFGNMTFLTYIALFSNQLQEGILDAIGDLASLTYLELFVNQLKALPKTFGEIPKSFGRRLVILDLSSNRLYGSIPDTVGSMAPLGCRSGIHNVCSFGVIPAFKRHHLRRHSCVRYRCYRHHSGIRFRRGLGDTQTPSHANKECHFGAVVGS
eukprot:XP_019081490.1 PREDICTED: receptor-like protein 12 [Vitis vinifera]